MFNRTTRRANTRADVLAPFPPRFIRRTTNCDSAEVDQLKFPFLRHARFVRSVERFENDRYLVAVHPLLNIENLFVNSKATFRISSKVAMRSASIARAISPPTRFRSPQNNSVTHGTTPHRSR